MNSIDDKLKDEINSEGFDCEDETSGNALLIGTKEEMPQLRERLYSNGHALDLGSYIKMHKKIVLPYEEAASEINGYADRGKGFIWNKDYRGTLNYVDKNRNIAEIKIDFEKIASFRDIAKEKDTKDPMFWGRFLPDSFIEEIKSLGFDECFLKNDRLTRKFNPLIEKYNEKNKPKKTFDF